MTSGDLLSEKALGTGHRLPRYTFMPLLDFSKDWLSRFDSRQNVKVRIWHGKAGSTPNSAKGEIKALRTLFAQFHLADILKMD